MKQRVSKEQLKKIILNTEPELTKEMVDNYTDSELKEWSKLLKLSASF
jgi:recombinational DNA repair protein RecR